MTDFTNTATLHIELTDKCQASCPMCARNYNGGMDREFVGKHDVSLMNFKHWFSAEWLATLENFYACGNYGDPIIAKDCLEIFEYVRSINSTCRMGIHTNGSARSKLWWRKLASVMGSNSDVVFGIDGYAESHVLYRRGTDWNAIIENAKEFMAAGGTANIDCLVFEHNELEITRFKEEMLAIGFSSVNLKVTSRFYDMPELAVQDRAGNIEYVIKPAKTINFIKEVSIPIEQISKNLDIWHKQRQDAVIIPKCVTKKELYVDARGNVFPCCWVGAESISPYVPETTAFNSLKNKLVADTQSRFNMIFNLNDHPVTDIARWSDLDKVWTGNDKAWICVKNCAA